MNPLTYDTFKNDMREASENFILNTGYCIKCLTSSSIILTNNRKDICFEIDGVKMAVSLVDLDNKQVVGIYELFIKENIMYKYPVDKEMKMDRTEWYKFLVKELLNILMKDLRKYIV